jgi:C_GCAxxG_C_C family probable redox protein
LCPVSFIGVCVQFKLDEETALKISCGFGAGMGRAQETCGAVTGAYMVIGLKYGKDKEKIYSKVREFTEKFKTKYKTTNCKVLLDGCDFLTEEGQKRFKEESFINSIFC